MNNSAVLNLFNKVLVSKKNSDLAVLPDIFERFSCVVTKDVLAELGEKGVVELLSQATSLDKMNNTFFTFLQTVETPDFERMCHQVVHYMTTYGYREVTGSENPNFYMPRKELFPEFEGEEENISVRIISGATSKDLQSMVGGVLSSNAGINVAQISMWRDVFKDLFTNLELCDLLNSPSIKNKDMVAYIANEIYPSFIPKDVDLMIRLACVRATTKSTKIASKRVISELSVASSDVLDNYVSSYSDASELMSVVWRRNRKYLLALKKGASKSSRSAVNRARKLADKNYNPVSLHPVLDATVVDNVDKFKEALPKISMTQLVRMHNACALRSVDQNIFFTRIRNGSVWYQQKKVRVPKNNASFLDLTKKEIASRSSLVGKKIYIPSGVKYCVPSSARDMVGFVPNFTTIELPDSDFALGVHWYDAEGSYVDLDLSYSSMGGGVIGWNNSWKNGDSDIIFSGDITSAPRSNGGAAEFIAVKKGAGAIGQFNLALFHPSSDYLGDNYTYTMFLNAPEKMSEALDNKNDYLLNSGRTLFQAPVSIEKRKSSLGYLAGDSFIVSSLSMNAGNIAGNANDEIIDWVLNNSKVKLGVLEYLELSGAEIVSERSDADISLDFMDLTANTWSDLGIF